MARFSLSGSSDSGPQIGENHGSITTQFLQSESSLNDACLRDLRTTDPQDDKDRIEETSGGLLKDSYCWILDNQQFKRWQRNQTNCLLWIRGDPGKGKTMLLCGIIDELTRSTGNNTNIPFFFCQANDSSINNATAVLRGLMYSLIKKQPSLLLHVRSRYDEAGKALFEDKNAWSAISKIFVDILNDPTLRNTYFVIDALDECTIGLGFLLDLIIRESNAYPQVKWIVSSRNRPDILQQLDTAAQIDSISLELNEEYVSQAVSQFIQHKVRHLGVVKKYSDEFRDTIWRYLLSKSEGTFLWVALVIQQLGRAPQINALKQLEKFPPGLNEIYYDMLNQICVSDDAELYLDVLSTVVATYRPLRLEELGALSGLPRDVWSTHESITEIVRMCGSFLTVQNDNVHIIHQSAKEYLSWNFTLFPGGISGKHYTIFSRSLLVMSNTLQRDVYSLHIPGFPLDRVNQPDPDPLGAARYSCIYWVDHLNHCYSEVLTKHKVFQDGGSVDQFLGRSYLNWLEALSLLRSVPDGIRSMAKLEGLLQKGIETPKLIDIVRDGRRFILYHKFAIENNPLQVYPSALVFSPARNIRYLFKHGKAKSSATKTAATKTAATKTAATKTAATKTAATKTAATKTAATKAAATKLVKEGERETLTQTLEGHSSWVNSVAFSLNSKRIASASNDRTVKIWDSTTYNCLQTLEGHSDWVNSVAFSPDSKWIASASNDCTVKIWDTATCQCLQTLKGHGDWVNSIAFSPDSKWIASASNDCTVKIWNAVTGKCLQTLKGHGSAVSSVAFAHNSKQIASASNDRTVKIWDSTTYNCLQTFEGHRDWIKSVAFSHDSKQIASASFDRTVKIWEVPIGICLQTLEGHSESVYSVGFLHDSKQVVSVSGERTVKVWDTATGKCMWTLAGHSESVISAAFSPDGKSLASSSTSGTVQLWDANKGEWRQGQGDSVAGEAENSLIAKATSDLPPNEQDEQASTTETSNTLWSYQASLTNPSSVSYKAVADMGQVTESRSSMTFFSYKKSEIEDKPHKRDDDIRSVKSMPDDIESLVGSDSGLANYQQPAVNYIVKMFTSDQELLGLYHEAVQLTDETKFLRNHRRLLKKFFLDLRSHGNSPSQTLAVRFLRSRSRRMHISSAIRSLVMPSDNTVREKINIMLEQEKDSLFLLDRHLDDRDSTAPPAPKNTADETFDAKPGIQPPTSDTADTASENSDDSDEDEDMKSDEPGFEIEKDNLLSILKATAEFLTSGRPFSLYKKNLREFLHPVPKADNLEERLQLDGARNSSLVPLQSLYNHSEGERGDVIKSGDLEVHACDTSQTMNNIDSTTGEQFEPPLQNSTRGLKSSAQLKTEGKGRKFLPSLPLLVDLIMQSLPFPDSEPPIPEGKVRARWTCRCGARLFDDFTELEPGSVKELERELQELGRSTKRTRNIRTTIAEAFEALLKPSEHPRRTQRPSSSNRGNILPLEEARQPSDSLHQSNATQQPNQPGTECQATLHLLLCIDKKKSGTHLHQEHLEGVTTDHELFSFLQSRYFGHWNVRSWFTLRSIASLSLSRFAVDLSNFAEVHKHVSTCDSDCVCLPTVDRLDTEYLCRPAPEIKPKYRPAIGTRRLTHYFEDPQSIDVTQKTVLAQLPKRLGHLSASSDQEQIGWGIHFQEDWHWRTINFLVFVLVASFSLVFAIVWSIAKGSIQDAFAISSFWLTLGSLFLGYMAVKGAQL